MRFTCKFWGASMNNDTIYVASLVFLFYHLLTMYMDRRSPSHIFGLV